MRWKAQPQVVTTLWLVKQVLPPLRLNKVGLRLGAPAEHDAEVVASSILCVGVIAAPVGHRVY